jgi:plastocyanin
MDFRHYICPLFAAVAGIAFAGCGGASSSTTNTTTSSTTARASSSSGVSIKDFKFAPATLTVDGGTRLTVTNDDSTAHTGSVLKSQT